MRSWIAGLACLLLLTGLATHELWNWWHQPGPGGESIILQVGEGRHLSGIAAELSDKGLLDWPRLWTSVARVQGLDAAIKQGEYRISGDMSPAAILDTLVLGRVILYSVTLPEGITLNTAIGLLHDQEPLRVLLDGSGDPRVMEMVAPRLSPEGLFFPDTYFFRRGETDLDILRQARRRMQQVLDLSWPARDGGLPYSDPYEALIMASIVEKETGLAAERERIAGVFVRRLQASMRLQTDPTVIYGLGPEFDGNLRRVHLNDRANPYNTYQHKGLPPTPIALPGRAAIAAAMHPAPGSELYFVARGDGSHVFSDTLEEHQQAVRQYQMRRSKDYRSTPEPGDI